jgi:ribosomal protein S12 methylthiotransferase accessory factor YcaO
LIAAANPRIGRLGGAAAGGAVWLGSYMGWIPAFGVLKPATKHPLRRDAVMLGAHFAWGWATAEAMRELADARATIFADGPEPDVPDGRKRRA